MISRRVAYAYVTATSTSDPRRIARQNEA